MIQRHYIDLIEFSSNSDFFLSNRHLSIRSINKKKKGRNTRLVSALDRIFFSIYSFSFLDSFFDAIRGYLYQIIDVIFLFSSFLLVKSSLSLFSLFSLTLVFYFDYKRALRRFFLEYLSIRTK